MSRQRSDPASRFFKFVEKTTDCWLWTGRRINSGYGTFWDGKQVLSHRWSYEHAKEPIPPEMTIDHLCRNKLCVNPDHMEVVTNYENNMRGDSAPAINARKTHCSRGHELAGANLVLKRGRRACRACDVWYTKEWRRKRTGKFLLTNGTPRLVDA